VQDVGHAVGPNLTRLSHRRVEDLVSNILDPNLALNPAFATVRVERQDGEGLTGILETETPDTPVLRQPSVLRPVVARRDIDRLEYTSKSLMPEGLEARLTPQDLRDLVACLQEQAPRITLAQGAVHRSR
jgi:putative heme-binding domain-containing protein